MGGMLLSHTRMGKYGVAPRKRFVTLHLFFPSGNEACDELDFPLKRTLHGSPATKKLAERLRTLLAVLLPSYRSSWGVPPEKARTVREMLELFNPPLTTCVDAQRTCSSDEKELPLEIPEVD